MVNVLTRKQRQKMRDPSSYSLLIGFLLLIALSVVYAHEGVEPTSYGLTGRIVNGTKAILRQFPHQVSLRRSWSAAHFCGGVIIHENYILTAGHCMYRNGVRLQPWSVLIVGGELRLDESTSTGQQRGVESIIIHPEFNLTTLQNDVALVKLAVPFKFTPELKSIPLSMTKIIPYQVCQVAGWGYPAADIPIASDDLMYVDLPIIEPDTCRKLLENVTHFPPGMYCAGYIEGGRDACQGDSGGGMVCNGVLTGIVSGGEGCAYPRLPGVYSDIFYYRKWIAQYTKIHTRRTLNDVVAAGASGITATFLTTISLLFLARLGSSLL